MEAHLQLTKPDKDPYPTISFGTGSLVRLPGPSISQPNVYQFNSTSYSAMYNELYSKDAKLYNANGILKMLDRNRGVKWGPERWQDWRVGVPRVGQRMGGEGDAEYSADQGYQGTINILLKTQDQVRQDLNTLRGVVRKEIIHVPDHESSQYHLQPKVVTRQRNTSRDHLTEIACRVLNHTTKTMDMPIAILPARTDIPLYHNQDK